MSVQSAVRGVVEEAASISKIIRDALENLDFSTTSLLAVRDKYTTVSQQVLALSYEQVVAARSLPPIDPTTLFDQVRLGLTEIEALGAVFFPKAPSGSNLKDVQEFYLSVDSNLTLVAQQLDAHPPGIPDSDTFDLAVNRFTVSTTGSRNPSGRIKTRDDIAAELGTESFETFVFVEIPQLIFIVLPVFVGINVQLEAESRKLDIPVDQLSCRAVWFGSVNPTSANFAKMKITVGLNNLQIRSASFGDDLARSSSSVFLGLIDDMLASFNLTGSSLPSASELTKILDAVQQNALVFLAQITFGTTVISDRDTVNDAREGGVTDAELEDALTRRSDPNFTGADFSANNLRTTVFPATSNVKERRTLGFALQQEPDTVRFTNNALNEPTNLREEVVTASKRMVASVDAHQIIIGRENVTQRETQTALLAVLADISDLSAAYNAFLFPPDPKPRVAGARTAESANNMLTRTCDLVKSLRIQDQITDFPEDFDNEIDADLEIVLAGLNSLASTIGVYLSVYRSGKIRDFLAGCVSVASMTNFLLADGEPESSGIAREFPAAIEQLRISIQSVLLDDAQTKVLYDDVSLQVEAFASVLRGTKEDDPVGRLLDLPVTVLDALLPSETFPAAFSIPLENGQEEALRQIRESFDVLRRTVVATLRDLGLYGSNFSSAFTDAEFFVARLSGDSVRDLITELRQS